ncbi:unnamed protein product [Triticum turgidum subsp. durum]|uniref:R13L1/DRL21-like LRR repeat region domain-containing protein n=1 Tax=Triticum turgidum subsp. durum TaxID=4567 RepID=A0A9R1ADV9_TRITD|nr:unnamed protein product [Triticum turgidum subsp. durum]
MFNLSKLRCFEWCVQIPHIGNLTSLQNLNEFCVQKKMGYEVRQLKDMNNLGGRLSIKNLENVVGKDQAVEAKLHQKSHLERLHLEWSYNDDMASHDSSHLETLEGLVPPPQIRGLTIKGYRYTKYPCWLLEDSYFQNLESLELVNCSALEILPSNATLFGNCTSLRLENVPNLRKLPSLPANLNVLVVEKCRLLMFTCNDELEKLDQRENPMMTCSAKSRLSSMWKADSRSNISRNVLSEYSSLRLFLILMDADTSHLQAIESALEREGDEVLVKEDIINAWMCCHEERIRLICTRNIGLPLVPPSGLCRLELSSCIITDGALVVCLDGLTSLTHFSLKEIMTLTTLPSQDVFQQLTKLQYLCIDSCWCLRSVGGLQGATALSEISLWGCPSLKLTRGSGFLPLSIERLKVEHCVVGADFLSSDLPHLKDLSFKWCRGSSFLTVGHLTALESLSLQDLQDLCFLEGLSSLQLFGAQFANLPNLNMKCISQLQLQNYLVVSSPIMLSHILLDEGFTVPRHIRVEECNEESFPFEESADFSSVKHLSFMFCGISSFPDLKGFSCLMSLQIVGCPNISSFQDLPPSLKTMIVWDCELLKESCRAPDGESWPKIEHIREKVFI